MQSAGSCRPSHAAVVVIDVAVVALVVGVNTGVVVGWLVVEVSATVATTVVASIRSVVENAHGWHVAGH